MVTIIILLILAGITISQLTGSGLFENAKLAEEKSKEAQEKEEGILDDYENKIDEYKVLSSSRQELSDIFELKELENSDIGTNATDETIYTYIVPQDMTVNIQGYVTGNGYCLSFPICVNGNQIDYIGITVSTEGGAHLLGGSIHILRNLKKGDKITIGPINFAYTNHSGKIVLYSNMDI